MIPSPQVSGAGPVLELPPVVPGSAPVDSPTVVWLAVVPVEAAVVPSIVVLVSVPPELVVGDDVTAEVAPALSGSPVLEVEDGEVAVSSVAGGSGHAVRIDRAVMAYGWMQRRAGYMETIARHGSASRGGCQGRGTIRAHVGWAAGAHPTRPTRERRCFVHSQCRYCDRGRRT
jgi:hypothetical protein